MPKITAIVSQKGGVAKSTTAVNLAAGIAKFGQKKTLVLDFDPQATATYHLNKDPNYKSVYQFLNNEINISDSLQEISENLYLIASDQRLVIIEYNLRSSLKIRKSNGMVSEVEAKADFA